MACRAVDRTPIMCLAAVRVFVCVGVLCVCVTERKKEDSSFELSTFASLTLRRANFSWRFRRSFNCFAWLISVPLTMSGGSRRPLLLSLPLSLTNSQSGSRARGCQRGNKVTGLWARRPLSDHMDWCCARHRSRWLTLQGSSHNTGTFFWPGPFIPPLYCFNLSHLLVPLFLPSVPLEAPSLSLSLCVSKHSLVVSLLFMLF